MAVFATHRLSVRPGFGRSAIRFSRTVSGQAPCNWQHRIQPTSQTSTPSGSCASSAARHWSVPKLFRRGYRLATARTLATLRPPRPSVQRRHPHRTPPLLDLVPGWARQSSAFTGGPHAVSRASIPLGSVGQQPHAGWEAQQEQAGALSPNCCRIRATSAVDQPCARPCQMASH